MNELTVLQAVRLKGRVRPAALAATLDEQETTVAEAVNKLGEAGLLTEGKLVRLSPAGLDRLTELLPDGRRGIDGEAFARAYDEFRSVNGEFKSLVSEWQLRDGEPNDHGDAEYDAAILGGLDGVHSSVLSLLAMAAKQLPRLTAYAAKLSAA